MTWWPLRTGPEDREPRPVAESLEATARRLGSPGVGVLGAIFARWEELVGPEIAAHARPRSLRSGVLVIEVTEAAWATQLRYLSADVMRRVGEAAGPEGVRELQIRVAGQPPATLRRGRRPGPRSDTPL